ncbi:MAG: ABC transporter permease subunit [Chloroflexota bacterium]
MHLLAADGVRFGRRRDLWLLGILVPVLLGVMFVSGYNSTITPPEQNFSFDPPDPVAEAQMREQQLADWRQQIAIELPSSAFPASLVKVASNLAPVILLAVYLATSLVAGEFEWGTVRTTHLTSSRPRTLAVRVGLIVGLVAVSTAAGLLFAAVIPFFLSFEGRALQDYAAPVPGLAPEVGIRLLAVVPFVAIPVLLAVLARSIALTFLLFLLFILFDFGVTGMWFWPSSPVPWVPATTVTGSIGRLLGGEGSSLAAVAPSWVAVIALLAWSIVPVLAALFRFRRLDITE